MSRIEQAKLQGNMRCGLLAFAFPFGQVSFAACNHVKGPVSEVAVIGMKTHVVAKLFGGQNFKDHSGPALATKFRILEDSQWESTSWETYILCRVLVHNL